MLYTFFSVLTALCKLGLDICMNFLNVFMNVVMFMRVKNYGDMYQPHLFEESCWPTNQFKYLLVFMTFLIYWFISRSDKLETTSKFLTVNI